jgi:hypothetical protein
MAHHASSLAEPSTPSNPELKSGEKAMLQQPRPGILLCLDRAGECERLAELAGDPRSKQTYIHIAGQWRALAAHQEFVGQMDSLLRREHTREA